jgi:hypothetical protein
MQAHSRVGFAALLNRQTGKAAITDVVSNSWLHLTCYMQMVAAGVDWLTGSPVMWVGLSGTYMYLS